MASREPIRLVGATASPYTQKMVALLRYRRIPHAVTRGSAEAAFDALGVERPRPVLMPTFFFEENGATRAVVDSTPTIRRLERVYDKRSVVPPGPALAGTGCESMLKAQ